MGDIASLFDVLDAHVIDRLQLMLACGADPDSRDKKGTPVLLLAVRNGDALSVQALLDAGADIDGTDADGCSAVHVAAQRCQLLL